ncbi:MAG: FAD-dependent oxidoreductase [Acidobacteriia bacterium]|nr:FAD-dependent oxidoreductase [Terriglobia bacterium]
MRRALPTLLATLLASLGGCGGREGTRGSKDRPETFDVVVYGGTSAAVTAAVQVRRMGKSVVVVSPDRHLGGLSSGGLGWTDTGDKSVIGGLAREFYHRIWLHYEDPEAWRWQARSEYGNRGQGTPALDGAQRTMWIFEPHVAEKVFEDLVAEHGIDVRRDEWLDRSSGVHVEDGRIRSIATESGARFSGSAFIDATYEGDLMAAAGVSYTVGREGKDSYGEEWAGVQKDARHHGHFFPHGVDPYVTPGDPASGLLPRISPEPPGENGSADHRIQAYCFRLCLTRVPENHVPFPRPEAYDPSQYELILRVFATGWRETFRKFDPIPNGKTDTNNHGPFSTDNIGTNYAYPEASYEARKAIVAEHETYQKGLLYFLANDRRVPADVREEFAQWGLARDEFTENGNWPHQLYIRESRRLLGEFVITEHECLAKRAVPDSVGMGSYAMDSHNVQRYVTAGGFVQNEGDIGVKPLRPYGIAFGSLKPRRQEVTNLLVPVCVSASHIAYGSIRMEPVFMILGQSAATAAVLAIEEGVAVQDLEYDKLRDRLLADGQILELHD